MNRETRKKIESMVTVERRWNHLPTLDWYVLREFLIKFSILLLVLSLLFILSDVFNDLGDFLEYKAPIGNTILYFLLRLPGNISFVLPIGVLLGCMWTMAMFGKNLEVTAMRASGLSLMRCGRSIFLMGFLVTLVNIYFNEMLVSEYNYKAEVLKKQFTRKADHLESYKKMLTFRSFDGRRVWLFQTFDDHGKFNGISLKFHRENNVLEKYITAKSATYSYAEGWLLEEGSTTTYSQDGFMPKSQITFQTLQLAPSEVPEDPKTIENAVREVDDLPCWTILEVILSSDNLARRVYNIYWTVFFYRLAFPWASFIAVLLGIPLATKNERSGIMMAVITSVVVIVAYIIVSEAFKTFGRLGYVPPVVAGLAPTLAFIIYGYWNVRRDGV